MGRFPRTEFLRINPVTNSPAWHLGCGVAKMTVAAEQRHRHCAAETSLIWMFVAGTTSLVEEAPEMRYAAWQPGLALFALLLCAGGATAQGSDKSITAYVDGDREAVIALLPSFMSRSPDAAAAEYPVISAVESVKRCLTTHRADYRVVFADRIVLRSGTGSETLAVPLIGVLLVRPGANPRIVFAGGGPEALAPLLRQASKGYFGEDCDGKRL